MSFLSYSCMFQVEICFQQLEICKSVCMFIVLAIVVVITTLWIKVKQSWMLRKHTHIPDNDYWGICLFHVVWTNFFFAIILMWYTRNIFLFFFFINWTLHMSDNLPERVQILGHVHIICITVLINRIICCQIFCDFLLKSLLSRFLMLCSWF